MKLNNRGFAISSIMYIILVLAVILISLTLATLSSRRLIIEKLKDETLKHIESICELVSGNPNEIGSKYQCKVKNKMEDGFEDGYYFYVLSHNNDGTTNLIMERNLYYDEENDVGKVATEENKGLVAWYESQLSHSYGPVTAMDYLHNATKDWNSIPNMIMNYDDENIDPDTGQKGTNGYGSIVTTDNLTKIISKNTEETLSLKNLKVRMPRYDEVHGEGKCLTYVENSNQHGSCPSWLVNYLSNTSSVKNYISGISGYWILSSNADAGSYGWSVFCAGSLFNNLVNNPNENGIRPVITIKI